MGRLELIGVGQSCCSQVVRKKNHRQDGLCGHGLKLLSTDGISSLWRNLSPDFKAFQLVQLGPP